MAGKLVKCMSAGEINRALDKLDRQSSEVTSEFIAAGRGHERPSEIRSMDDPLARRLNKIFDDQSALRVEISLRYGPGAPSRLPPRFGPRDKELCRRKKAGLEGRRRR